MIVIREKSACLLPLLVGAGFLECHCRKHFQSPQGRMRYGRKLYFPGIYLISLRLFHRCIARVSVKLIAKLLFPFHIGAGSMHNAREQEQKSPTSQESSATHQGGLRKRTPLCGSPKSSWTCSSHAHLANDLCFQV